MGEKKNTHGWFMTLFYPHYHIFVGYTDPFATRRPKLDQYPDLGNVVSWSFLCGQTPKPLSPSFFNTRQEK